jgi:CDP-paratose synthetase
MRRKMAKNFLFTGGTGFLGSHIVRLLAQNSDSQLILLKRVRSKLNSLAGILPRLKLYDLERTPLERVFEDQRIHTIVHCATNYGRDQTSASDIVDTNLCLPLKLLELGERSGNTAAFINTDTILNKGISAYSLSKKQFRDWLEVFSRNMTCVNMAFEHFFGPGDNPSKFVSFIVRNILEEAESLPLTPGEQRRDFIFIDDVARAAVRLIQWAEGAKKGFFDFEVGTGRSIPIREFVLLAKKLAGNTRTRLDFGALPYRPNEIMDAVADNRAVSALGWRPEVSLEEGLRLTIEAERKRPRP